MMTPQEISQFGKGAIKNKIDIRDYRYKPSIKASQLPEEYSIRDKVGKIKYQNGSSSCVAQAFAYYAQVNNLIETGEQIELSARDIYSKIFLPNGGAYLRDAAKKLCNSGICLEKDASSYENGNPPSEEFMRKRDDITTEEEERAMVFVGKDFKTWTDNKIDTAKSAIYENNGAVIAAYGNNYCWGDDMILTPDTIDQCSWGHGIYCTGWKKINGEEYIEFVNSWGTPENNWGDMGFGYIPKSYFDKGFVFNPVTYTDHKNNWYEGQLHMIDVLKNIIDLITQLLKLKKP